MTDSFRVAVDVGGTFIDYVLLNEENGAIVTEKEASSVDSLAEQVMQGLRRLPEPADRIDRLFHGMTVGINTLLQDKGAPVGLITTRGFRDTLEIGRGNRKEVYNYLYRGPMPLIERHLRREVPERMDFQGNELQALDEIALDRETDYLLEQGVEAIAVVFLHAYANPAHERAAAARIGKRYPQLPVSLSHELASEWREYERTSTTVLNAYIQPLVKQYLDTLAEQLSDAGYRRPIAIMQSNGGVCDAGTAGAKPIRTLMSGPAGGVIGAQFLCQQLGFDNVICTDVGGTTYDVSLIENGKVLEQQETSVADRPILGSLIDITSIGAGGGSIAWLDHRNALQVGPQSAGATPGPVCFGLGGVEPTVTDAHLVLGHLDPNGFLGGRMELDIAASRAAIEAKVGLPLGLTIENAAAGILAIAETNMANAIRSKTVSRGLDPREFVMLAYGGGGGLFAAAVADDLEMGKIIVPVAPANFSAWGILTSDYIEDASRTKVMAFDSSTVGEVVESLESLRQQCTKAVARYGFDTNTVGLQFRVDIRYVGQEYTLAVDPDENLSDASALQDNVRRKFVAMHRQLYGHGENDDPLEIVATRCRGVGAVQPPRLHEPDAVPSQSVSRTRSVYFRESSGFQDTPVLQREQLGAEAVITGPAIIEEWSSTTVIPPRWSVRRGPKGELVLEKQECEA